VAVATGPHRLPRPWPVPPRPEQLRGRRYDADAELQSGL